MFIGGPLDVLHQILALYTLRDPQLFCALSAAGEDRYRLNWRKFLQLGMSAGPSASIGSGEPDYLPAHLTISRAYGWLAGQHTGASYEH